MLAKIEYPDKATALSRREEDFNQSGESLAILLGTECTHLGFHSGTPYQVLLPEHWVVNSTGLNYGELFG